MSLKDYIQGKRRGKAANELEREALNDPFLQDAIDGFDSVPGEHLPVIEQLERQISGHSQHRNWWWLGIAASIAVIIGLGFLFQPQTETAIIAKRIIKTEIKTLEHKDTIEKQTDSIAIRPIAAVTPRRQKIVPMTDDTILAYEKKAVVSESVAVAATQKEAFDNKEISKFEEKSSAQTMAFGASVPKPANKIIGLVVDEKGEPLIGADVKLEKSNRVSVTDYNGKFELNTDRNTTEKLVASYIGYNNKKVAVKGDTVRIQLEPNNSSLSEVVVVGYGTAKKRSLTGAVAGIAISESKSKSIRIDSLKHFGEKEFRAYFEKNRKQSLCENKRTQLKANFVIDANGKPTELDILECDCLELEEEFIHLFHTSPKWTKPNQKIKFTLKIN